MPDASPDLTSDTPPKKRRFRLRYSLRSLLIFILLVNSACLLWLHWEPWTLETTLKGHTEQVNNAVFSPDGKRVVTGSHDRTACVWNVFTGKSLMVLKPEIGFLLHVRYSRDGKIIFTSSSRVGLAWDAETGKAHDRARQYYLWPRRWLPVTKDGKRSATANSIGVVIVWEVPSPPKPAWEGKPIYKWRAHNAAVLSLAFSHDGSRLVTAGKDGLAKIWRYRHPEQWWGILLLLEFWMTLALAALLGWSVWRDWHILRKTTLELGDE